MVKFITILLANAALETFPSELVKDLEIRQYLSKLRKKPTEIILDANYHSNFMKSLPDAENRGRPDITHFALLSVFGSILAREKRIKVIIHTCDNKIIFLDPEIRLPKSLERFNGLILQLLKHKRIPPASNEPLMELSESSLEELIKKLRLEHDIIIEFSVEGKKCTALEYSELIHYKSVNPLLIFGAFPHGHIKEMQKNMVDHKIAIYKDGLDLFSVIAQILGSIHTLEEESIVSNSPKSEKMS